MKTVFIYRIRKPRSMVTEFSTDCNFAEEKSNAGYVVNCNIKKVIM